MTKKEMDKKTSERIDKAIPEFKNKLREEMKSKTGKHIQEIWDETIKKY
jgi:hypothetical protein